MENENYKLSGLVSYVLKDKNGNIKETREIPNLLTVTGKANISGLILVDTTSGLTPWDYIAIGTGSGQTKASTTLNAEITTNGGQRRGGADVTGSVVTTTDAGDTAQLVTNYTFTNSFAVTESGVFNNTYLNGGIMLCYQSYAAINVVSGDQLQITWKIKSA